MRYEHDSEKLLPINIIRTGHVYHQPHVIRSEGFAAYQIAVCASGEGKFIYHNDKHIIKENDIFLFSPRVKHEYYPVTKNWEIYYFVFSGECVENLFKYFRFDEAEVFSGINNTSKIRSICELMMNTDDNYLLSLYLYELLGLTVQLPKLSSQSSTDDKEHFKKIAPVTDYIKDNYKQTISLEELADLINVSKSYLCRIFKETHGITPIKYLQSIRVNKAKQLLSSTDMKLKKICSETGFNDISYFCMIFKEHEGMTPEEFRTLHTY